jgi:hypothetical protein
MNNVTSITDHLRDQRDEAKDLELAHLHRTIEIMREYCEAALAACMHPKSGPALALRSAIMVAVRASK